MTRKEKIKVVCLKYNALSPFLNERSRRCWAATEAKALGWGGMSLVCEATGMDLKTVRVGLREINHPTTGATSDRIRRVGGGRKKLTEKNPDLLAALDTLVEPTSRGDPSSPLRWTCKSTVSLAQELVGQGYCIGQTSVGTLLKTVLQYRLQSNRKTAEGASHPDRDAQFHFINDSVKEFQTKKQPVISVDTKKKELIGNFKNPGTEWRPKGQPRQVNLHDFVDPELGKVIPYGVYDLAQNEGWVNVGIDHDTASFAVASIRQWWKRMGSKRYPKAKELLITADCGGSNGNRSKLWKVELQKLADEVKMTIHVRHFPPGTSKWNKIEHRLFSFISHNWRGQPLLTRAAVVNLIANTKTKTGLQVQAVLDENRYEKGRKVSDAEIASLNLAKESFHGEWNYRIAPKKR
jgi:hypothetical protein